MAFQTVPATGDEMHIMANCTEYYGDGSAGALRDVAGIYL